MLKSKIIVILFGKKLIDVDTREIEIWCQNSLGKKREKFTFRSSLGRPLRALNIVSGALLFWHFGYCSSKAHHHPFISLQSHSVNSSPDLSCSHQKNPNSYWKLPACDSTPSNQVSRPSLPILQEPFAQTSCVFYTRCPLKFWLQNRKLGHKFRFSLISPVTLSDGNCEFLGLNYRLELEITWVLWQVLIYVNLMFNLCVKMIKVSMIDTRIHKSIDNGLWRNCLRWYTLLIFCLRWYTGGVQEMRDCVLDLFLSWLIDLG